RDLRRFALREAMAHYKNALRATKTLPETPTRNALELAISLGLGMAQQIGIGPASQEAAAHYRQALTLSATLPDRGRERFLATWGIWFHETMTGRTQQAIRQSDDLVAIARELNDTDLLLEAYHARTPGLLRIPDFVKLREASEEVIRLYDRERHRDHAYY